MAKKQQQIWKYNIPNHSSRFDLSMPKDAQILTVQTQHGEPKLWALVTPEHEDEIRMFALYGTGKPLEIDPMVTEKYIGSFQMLGGSLVWHLFELEIIIT